MRFCFPGLALAVLTACAGNPEPDERRGFYYWRTILEWTDEDTQFLRETGAARIYVRVFDVDIENGRAVPVSPLVIRNRPPVKLVPVVFIQPSVFSRLSEDSVLDLAENVRRKAFEAAGTADEIQIDYDWTPSTRDVYFLFLRTLRRRLTSETVLSATIRLHQVKFRERTGVPPVDRGALMVYGTGRPSDPDAENSILDLRAAAAYLKNQPRYSIPLDAALPVYSWAVLFRGRSFRRLLGEVRTLPGAGFSREGSIYCAESNAAWQEYRLSPGDCVRIEIADPSLATKTEDLVLPLLGPDSRVLLFHYSQGLKDYGAADIRRVFDIFRGR